MTQIQTNMAQIQTNMAQIQTNIAQILTYVSQIQTKTELSSDDCEDGENPPKKGEMGRSVAIKSESKAHLQQFPKKF